MKKRFFVGLFFLILIFALNCNTKDRQFHLTIAHTSDTHAHVESQETRLNINGEKMYLTVGGFPVLVTKVNQLRQEKENLLIVHAGDVFQGTLYFKKYNGLADLEFLNLMGLDALVLGNHEFDKGTEPLANFVEKANFDILSANMDALSDKHLASKKVLPYTIKEYDGEKVAIIGLSIETIPSLSSPGPDVKFADPISTAQKIIDELTVAGVNKIILLNHLGFSYDVKVAKALTGVDVIVGGHSHSLLGDVNPLGFSSAGEYPAVVQNAHGEKVLIVHSWNKNRLLGILDITFDGKGQIIEYSGTPVILAIDDTTAMMEVNIDGEKIGLSQESYNTLVDFAHKNPQIELLDEDPVAKSMVEKFSAPIKELYAEIIAQAGDDLPNTLSLKHAPGQSVERGSQIGKLVADGMMWKMGEIGQDVQFAIQNSGGIRRSINKGDVTVGHIQELLPFGNSLTVIELPGKKIKQALEDAIALMVFEDEYGAFHYVSHMKYTAKIDSIVQITEILVKDEDGNWLELEDEKSYRFVTNNYLAGGGGGYPIFNEAKTYQYDSGFVDAEMFIEYAQHLGVLKPINDKRFELIFSQ